jgi:hypothetical protein
MSNISLKIWKWFHGNFKLSINSEYKMKKIDIKFKFQVLGSSKVTFGFIILIYLKILIHGILKINSKED